MWQTAQKMRGCGRTDSLESRRTLVVKQNGMSDQLVKQPLQLLLWVKDYLSIAREEKECLE